ncbi:uncharacterized protein BYT42DRAFT_562525 [Radiomyces spectabilis]|uniref:uncharacterized protein n=1 Tax=Radiomyces spectabilis TaxID=64574 RepID=UPI00221F19D5|nr:uncharacterized protein BYT42DRAFT_562525 [Radiomyces spectabilis]KAI8384429.1 hypothetical protein BYT42DRAFT_562525 [Radiomyces spectabilis]
MKTKVKLHNHASNGRIDTFQFAPYRFERNYNDMQKRLTAVYQASYNQAGLLLQAIQLNRRQRLHPNCIRHLADFVVQAWEVDPTPSVTTDLVALMNNILNTTALMPEAPLDDALKAFCRGKTSTPTVCPNITLLMAVHYIQRLKQRYGGIRGTKGCSQRLIMVAYMVASKFIHTNLRSIIHTEEQQRQEEEKKQEKQPSPKVKEPSPSLSDVPPRRGSKKLLFENDTLPPLRTDLRPLSPPTSPTFTASELEKYHYFEPNMTDSLTPKERTQHIVRMEIEFLHFINYNLSLMDIHHIVHWAHLFMDKSTDNEPDDTANDAGDEMGSAD